MPRKTAPTAKPRTVKKPTPAQVISATVRPSDESAWYGNNAKAADLMRRYAGDVKVAAGLNASGVASTPIRVFRRTQGAKSAWASKRLDSRDRARLKSRHVGTYAQKAASYAGDMEEVTDPDHPLVHLLCEFNSVKDDGYNGIEDTVLAQGLAGNSYWLKVYQAGTPYPTELWTLPPQHVRAVPDRERFIGSYIYGRGTETEQPYDASEVVHFKLPNPLDPYYGLGDLQACLIHADISFDLALFWKATLDNACQPGLVISGAGVTSKTIEEMREAMDRRYRGVKKAAINAIFSGDIKVEKWALDKTDFSNLAGSGEVRGMIARAFGMPVEFLEMRAGGMSDGKGVAEYQWQKRGLKPRCIRIENKINSQLVDDFRAALGDDTLFVAFDDAVEEDRAAKVAEAKDLFASNLYSRDRALSVLGDDAVDGEDVYSIDLTTRSAIDSRPITGPGIDGEAGDVGTDAEAETVPADAAAPAGADVQATVLNGAQVASLQEMVRAAAAKEIPLEAVTPMMMISFPNTPPDLIQTLVTSLTGFEPPKPEPTQAPGNTVPGDGDKPKPGGGGDPDESGDSLKHSVAGETVSAPPGSLKALLESHAHGRKAAGAGDIVPASTEFRKAMQEFFDAWSGYTGNAVTSAIRMGEAVGVTFTEAPILYGNDEAFRELADRITRESMKPMLSGHNNAAGVLIGDGKAGDVVPWKTVPGDAEQFLRDNAAGTADGVLRNYDQSVRSAVSRELADTLGGEALTTEKLNAAVARAIPGVNQAKAVQIAESETTRAFSAGQKRAFDDSPFTSGYEWVCGSEPCPFCESLGGKIVAKDEGFLELGGTMSVGDSSYTNDYEAVEHPPLHPACICYLRPVYKPEAGAIHV